GEVITWDTATGKQLTVLEDHKKAATGAAFSPDGKLMVTTSFDETVNVYSLGKEAPLGFFGGHGRPTTSALFSPDGRFVVTGSGGRAKGKNEIKFWTPREGEELATIGDHAARVTDIAISPDGRVLFSSSYDKTVCIWNLAALAAGDKKPVATTAATTTTAVATAAKKPKSLRAGIIGLDTSHVIAFTRILNADKVTPELAGCRVVAAYPKGSPDIESSTSRVPGYIKQVKEMGVKIVDSIPELVKQVDVVFLETNDGRPHLEQVLPVLKAGKPTFIDKPIAGSLTDAVAIFEAARKYKTPVFSSSSLRYGKTTLAVRGGSIGKVTKCETTSPCSLEKTHPDLFWYGIHGVESLFTVMGAGCETVVRAESTAGKDVVVGTWKGGRTGTFTGLRPGKGYSGTATGTKGTYTVGSYDGYKPLVVDIVRFFRTGKSSIPNRETIEIYAFMEAADVSKRMDGKPVSIKSVLARARKAAKKRLAELDK
ncbi:MAG: Gfo/Idh/MocA family oxidoreductase, partial [Planctomycetota bacterium]|nr:Gfo/Idh/MocA family oxidoreductase [Planctomycetota bacterium]